VLDLDAAIRERDEANRTGLELVQATNVLRERIRVRDEALKLAAWVLDGLHSSGLWRCEGCGEAKDMSPAWRWTSEAWEHRCAGMHPQAGYMSARWFGDPKLAAALSACRAALESK
jgi:hypothetical protein